MVYPFGTSVGGACTDAGGAELVDTGCLVETCANFRTCADVCQFSDKNIVFAREVHQVSENVQTSAQVLANAWRPIGAPTFQNICRCLNMFCKTGFVLRLFSHWF